MRATERIVLFCPNNFTMILEMVYNLSQPPGRVEVVMILHIYCSLAAVDYFCNVQEHFRYTVPLIIIWKAIKSKKKGWVSCLYFLTVLSALSDVQQKRMILFSIISGEDKRATPCQMYPGRY